MLALDINLPFEMWLLLVAGVIAGIGRVVEWTQKARKQSAERQQEREGQDRAILVEPQKPERAESRGSRVLEIGTMATGIGSIKSVFAPEKPAFEVAEKKAPPRRPKKAPTPEPVRLTLGEFEELLATQPGPELVEGRRRRRRRTKSKVHRGSVHSHPEAIAVHIPASMFERSEIRRAIVLREILGPPKAALYLKGVRTRN